MKKNLLYTLVGLIAMFATGCQEPEFVSPTVKRQGITSITAIFTSGPYVDKEAIKYIISDNTVNTYVIPVPWFFPEDSENETSEYMSNMRIKIEIANNCIISPAVTVLDLTKDNHFQFTEPDGTTRDIIIRGERTKSNKCELKTFDIIEPEMGGVIDQDKNTISIITVDDILNVKANYSLSAHATMVPDLETIPFDITDKPFEVTVMAHNGVDKKVYNIVKAVPQKIPYGYRSGSEKLLFNLDIQTLGFAWKGTNAPSLASIGNNLVVCMGDGTVPVYLNKITGSKIGNVNIGSAKASCVTSDIAGNLLICNYAAGGDVFTVYSTNSVTKAPTQLLSYSNTSGLPIGSKVSVQGDIMTNAKIIATCDGIGGVTGSSSFVRWIITNGVVGAPQVISISGVGTWGAPVSNTKVVSIGVEDSAPYFLSYYDPNICYYVDGATNAVSSSIVDDSGNSWGMNDNCLDAKVFNNAKYMTLFCVSHFPHWGMAPVLYLYDVSKPSSFTGSLSTSPALAFSADIESKNSDMEGVSATGDVLLVPSIDGYKLNLYYFDNNCKTIGGYEFDCIDR